MPKRKFTTPKKTYKKKSFKKKPTRNNYLQKLPATNNMSMKPEVKTFDCNYNITTSPTEDQQSNNGKMINFADSGRFRCINLPSEGSAFYNRIGRKISMKSIRVKYHLLPFGGPNALDTTYRVMIVYDRQTNGSFPQGTDIITSKPGTLNSDSLVHGFLNMANSERFTVLMDKWHYFPSNDSSVGTFGGLNQSIAMTIDFTGLGVQDRFVKLKGLETTFKASSTSGDGASGAIGDIATGGLYIVAFSTQELVDCGWHMVANTRLRYLDT